MRKILGVNFGAGSLNAAVIEARFRMARPFKSEETDLPEVREEREKVMSETFKRWKKEYAPDGVVLGLPLQNFSHQLLEMPAMNRPDLRKALLFELEKYLPLPVDEYVFDFIASPAEKGRLKVLVLALRKELLNDISRFAREADISVLSIRCGAITALCGLLDAAGEKNLNGLFVNITDNAYEIAGLKDSMPVFMKVFPKKTDLQPELERLLVLYPGAVYFMGNADPHITEKFNSRKFHIPVPNSLASSEVKRPCLNMNFLPPELMKQRMDYYPYALGGLSAAAVIIFLLTGLIVYYKDWSTLNSIESKRAVIKQKASGVLEARKKLDLLQSDRKVLMDFAGRSNIAIRVMNDLSLLLPKNAWLINFSVDDKGKVELEGFTNKTSELVLALENSKAFRNVSFSAPIIAKDGEERFALKMEVEAEGHEKK